MIEVDFSLFPMPGLSVFSVRMWFFNLFVILVTWVGGGFYYPFAGAGIICCFFLVEKQWFSVFIQIIVWYCLEVNDFFLLLHPASEEGKQ